MIKTVMVSGGINWNKFRKFEFPNTWPYKEKRKYLVIFGRSFLISKKRRYFDFEQKTYCIK
jgi:hypothetical protein